MRLEMAIAIYLHTQGAVLDESRRDVLKMAREIIMNAAESELTARTRQGDRRRQPSTTSVSLEEGGPWLPFHQTRADKVHAVRFEDGSEWDAINGWRQSTQLRSGNSQSR